MATLSDRDIVERMRRNDPSGLEALLRQYGPSVKVTLGVKFADRADPDAIEDAVHDAAIAVHDRAGQLDPGNNLSGYFRRVALNLLWQRVPRETHPPVLLDHETLELELERRNGSPEVAANELSRRILECIASLPDLQRDIFALDLGSAFTMSAEAIAAELGTTPDTVYARRKRTRQRLEPFLRDWRPASRPSGRRS